MVYRKSRSGGMDAVLGQAMTSRKKRAAAAGAEMVVVASDDDDCEMLSDVSTFVPWPHRGRLGLV